MSEEQKKEEPVADVENKVEDSEIEDNKPRTSNEYMMEGFFSMVFYMKEAEVSKDIIDLIETHDDEENLLDKLGLSKKVKDPSKMTTKQKEDYEQQQIELKENQEKARVIIDNAKAKLEQIRQQTEATIQKVEDLKQDVIDKKAQLEQEKLRGPKIEAEYEAKIEMIRQNKIGELYWIMKESQQDDKLEHKDAYFYIINNLLISLYKEDRELAELKEDKPSEMQRQIHENYKRQFDDFAKKARLNARHHNEEFDKLAANGPKGKVSAAMAAEARRNGKPWELTTSAKQFRLIFPRPRPPKERREEFGQFYQIYEDWVREEFKKDDDEDGGILEDSVADDSNFSSVGASVNVQSTADIAAAAKAGGGGDAIAEGDEDEK